MLKICSDDYALLLHWCLKPTKNNIKSVLFCITYNTIVMNRYVVMFLIKESEHVFIV